jgi:hypothetical protein
VRRQDSGLAWNEIYILIWYSENNKINRQTILSMHRADFKLHYDRQIIEQEKKATVSVE